MLAASATLLHFLFNSRYGFFRDELYYAACGEHLAWGYVDHAPLVALVSLDLYWETPCSRCAFSRLSRALLRCFWAAGLRVKSAEASLRSFWQRLQFSSHPSIWPSITSFR